MRATHLPATTAIALAAAAVVLALNAAVGGQSGVPRTAWGDPNLEGIWNDVFQTPLQRPERFGDREFLTESERAELDERRGAMRGRDRRGSQNSERDVAGAIAQSSRSSSCSI